ncbi:MAG: hypothetical protein AAGJ81_04075 [Verrucomicrobiota bacterium]
MISFDENSVSVLRSSDNRVFELEIDELSEADQLYVSSINAILSDSSGDEFETNFIVAGDFEKSSKTWSFPNQEKAFRRASSKIVEDYSNSPDLGSRVLKVRPTENDKYHRDGPPYVTQTVSFKEKPARVLVSIDALYSGTDERGFRALSMRATDPNLRYVEGSGYSFPSTYKEILNPGEWHHFEWVADLSEISGDRVTFGFMLTHEEHEWYLDNVSVRKTNLPAIPRSELSLPLEAGQ